MHEAITVGSSNVDLGDSLREHVREQVSSMADKYLQHLTRAAVHFNHEGVDFRCSVNVQVGSLPLMAGEALAKDAYQAFNQALEKVAKQLRRTKRAVREDKAQRIDKQVPFG
ncbi:MAG: sigma 54 modulation protein/ribosomal protein [Hyphomicrobiales bacterium]|nr:sigma 54 modulation protein/ribosomal protein [Hyphomicrobiales bacterium]